MVSGSLSEHLLLLVYLRVVNAKCLHAKAMCGVTRAFWKHLGDQVAQACWIMLLWGCVVSLGQSPALGSEVLRWRFWDWLKPAHVLCEWGITASRDQALESLDSRLLPSIQETLVTSLVVFSTLKENLIRRHKPFQFSDSVLSTWHHSVSAITHYDACGHMIQLRR